MDFDLGPQEKFSLHQFLFVNTWWRIWWTMWYKRITVVNRKNMYTNKPLILTPNHQNAAMDPLAMVGAQTRQIVWLARADIFKNKFTRPILLFFKIMPIYRMRDGASSLGKNEEIFKKSAEVLKANKILALFPEAQHWGFRRLRAVQKAVPRIAFMAEEANNYNLDIHILPVGIYYQDYVKMRKNLFVNIGEPYSIKEYVETFKTNPTQAFQDLRKRIQDEMRALMLDIKHEGDLYTVYDELRFMCEHSVVKKKKLKGKQEIVRHIAQDTVIKTLDIQKDKNNETIEKLSKEVLEYKSLRDKLHFREWIIAQDGGDTFLIIWNCLKLVVGLPIFIVGFFTNFLKFHFIYKLAKKVAKDELFHNSITFTLGYILTPISYLILSIAAVNFTHISNWHIITSLIILFIIAIISFEYSQIAKKTFHMFRYEILKAKKSQDLKDALKRRKSIIAVFESFI